MKNAIAEQRARTVLALRDTTLNVLVIGGGIVGAGVARDAAMRGLRVGFLPQEAVSGVLSDEKTLWAEMLTAFSDLLACEAELRQLEHD
ncbi:MAG: hypothetical protein AAB380_03370, partial [Verrucomicrobiota bacterium]